MAVSWGYSMTEASHHFLKELNEVISKGSPDSCARAVWRATDILIEGRYTEDQIWVFGEVIARLSEEIEQATRAKLAKRLAHTDNAPFKVIKILAADDSIDVAGPVLQYSRRLDTKSLVTNIRTKSQPHLLAISKRCSIPVEVTDELVTRGNGEVVRSVASNNGACISDFGFMQMIKRSEADIANSVYMEKLGLQSMKTAESETFHDALISAIRSLTQPWTMRHVSVGPGLVACATLDV